jgi:hypothetical protein
MKLVEIAAPGIEKFADDAAEAACNLADVATPDAWSTGAVEDAVEAIDTLAEALAQIHPDAARILAAIPAATAELRRHLAADAPEPAKGARPPERRGRRRGLGHGWQGVRVPS